MPKKREQPKVACRDDALDYGPLERVLGFQVRRTQLRVFSDFMLGSPAPGLTPGHTTVLVLIEHNPNLTQQRLSDWLGLEKSTLVVLLHKLSARGLIRRVRSSVDRRHNVLELTDKGRAQVRAMLAHIAYHEDRVFSVLGRRKRQQLLQLLLEVNESRAD